MQLSIEFELEQCMINLDWRRMFLSYIKSMFEKESPELFEQFYGEGKTCTKKFTFWSFLPGAIFKEECIELSEKRVTLWISSTDTKILMYLYNASLRHIGKKYPVYSGNSMKSVRAKIQKTKQICDTEIIVKMLSPLVVRQHYKDNPDQYYLYNESQFLETLKHNMKTVLSCSDEMLPEVSVIKGKKVIIKSMGTSIPANLGIFRISGDVNLLQQMYLNGWGSRSSAGFGKFEIIG